MTNHNVALYKANGHFLDLIEFKYKWQAWLFHVLLDRTYTHKGRREY